MKLNIFKRGLRRCVQIAARKRIFSARTAACLLHRIEIGRFPDIDNPRDLNEKILWLEFNTDTSEWTRLADKIHVRDYVAQKGLGDILVPLIATYTPDADIDFDALPDSFVIKSNNGSAQSIIVDDKSKADFDAIREKIGSWFRGKNFAYATAEPHYLRIKPQILIEARLQTPDSSLPADYKFLCIDGKVTCCQVCSERNSKDFHCLFGLYDVDNWKEIPDSTPDYIHLKKAWPRPAGLEKMIKCAEILSAGFPFVRIDLYDIDGKVYFGEMTFTPAAGRMVSINQRMLAVLGPGLDLSRLKS